MHFRRILIVTSISIKINLQTGGKAQLILIGIAKHNSYYASLYQNGPYLNELELKWACLKGVGCS